MTNDRYPDLAMILRDRTDRPLDTIGASRTVPVNILPPDVANVFNAMRVIDALNQRR